jgi:streptomycin 6-kinase
MSIMATLKKNIINANGQQGESWINTLETTIALLQKRWLLTEIHPVNNMSWNYVALCRQNGNPGVLKIGCDAKAIKDEFNALQHFAGAGAIKVIDYDAEYHALLLEQAIPGYLLKEHHPKQMEDVIGIYAAVVKKLTMHSPIQKSFKHVSEWCAVIDNMDDPRIPARFIIKAKALRTMLLSTIKNEYLCHGDLHFENIIQHHSEWLSIDPKGVIGEVAFEAAACDLISDEELSEPSLLASKLTYRIQLLSQALDLDKNRLIGWIFLRIMLSIQWFVEDKGDPTRMLENAHFVFPLLTC